LDRDTYLNTGEPILTANIRSSFTDPRLTQSSANNLNTNLTALLNYDRVFADAHSLNIMAGVTRERFQNEFFSAYRKSENGYGLIKITQIQKVEKQER